MNQRNIILILIIIAIALGIGIIIASGAFNTVELVNHDFGSFTMGVPKTAAFENNQTVENLELASQKPLVIKNIGNNKELINITISSNETAGQDANAEHVGNLTIENMNDGLLKVTKDIGNGLKIELMGNNKETLIKMADSIKIKEINQTKNLTVEQINTEEVSTVEQPETQQRTAAEISQDSDVHTNPEKSSYLNDQIEYCDYENHKVYYKDGSVGGMPY